MYSAVLVLQPYTHTRTCTHTHAHMHTRTHTHYSHTHTLLPHTHTLLPHTDLSVCPDVPIPANHGSFQVTNQTNNRNTTGTKVTVSCASGYQPVGGHSVITCNSQGHWMPNPPACGGSLFELMVCNFRKSIILFLLHFVYMCTNVLSWYIVYDS